MKLLLADKRSIQINFSVQLPALLHTPLEYLKSPGSHAERSEASRHRAMLRGLDSSAPPQNDNSMKSSNAREMGFRIVLAMIFTITLLLADAINAQPDDWLSYYPAVSRLQGKLTKVYKYGKPSYGEEPEKDEKVEVPILILQTPVRVRARANSSVNNESATNISFVQLIFPAEANINYAKHLDQDIVVGGTLTRGFRGEHFTDVVMTVKAVNPTGKPM
ncbi:MAG: hypothetical protein ACREQO_25925 [Candidatus Binatia bacterium]